MTYLQVKHLASAYLRGDSTIPDDKDVMHAVLDSAYLYMANKCTALKLLTPNTNEPILRMGPGQQFIRMPRLPRDNTDQMDIDHELCPGLSRLLAHYFAKDINMKEYHKREANEIIADYEAKVMEYLENQREEELFKQLNEQ